MIRTSEPTIDVASISDVDLFRAYCDRGIKDIVSVPCSITDWWHDVAARAAARGEIHLTFTTHEGNLAGIAAGVYFGTGRAALVHLQNSGLPNAGDGFISFANPALFRIPMAVMVTYRGATTADDSEPHFEIGTRTDALCETIFGPEATITGDRSGRDLPAAVIRSIAAANNGSIGVVKVAADGLRKTESPKIRFDESPGIKTKSTPLRNVVGFEPSHVMTREDSIQGIIHAHPGAAFIFSNGYTARCARAIADSAANFYNIGYMGGSLAI